jgi:hypothetical protein
MVYPSSHSCGFFLQCSIDMKDNVLRVGGGEIAVPFLQERDLPIHLHDDKRLEELPPATGASSSTVNLHPPAPVHAPTDSSTQDTNKRARSAEVTSLKAVCNDDV